MIVCFRSLRQAYRVRKASSPYSTLIEGHYDAFYIAPRFFEITFPFFLFFFTFIAKCFLLFPYHQKVMFNLKKLHVSA